MSHCVPDWDGNGGELEAVLPTTDYSLPIKGKWESLKRPTHDAIEPEWSSEIHILAMQGQSGKSNKLMWQQVNFQNTWANGQESEDAVTPAKPVNTSSPGKEPILVGNEHPVDAHHTSTPVNLHDDELVSWLQYPLDDSLERNYCSDFFGELPNSNITNMQLLKDSFGVQTQAGIRNSRNPGPVIVGGSSMNGRISSADAAMAMGAGRAAGLLPQTGAEVFTKVRTTMQPYGGKWSPSGSQSNAGKSQVPAPSSAPGPVRSTTGPGNASSPMLPPKSQGLSFQPPRTSGPMNFSHFSRPAAVMKASLQCLGMSHGVPPHGTGANVRLKSQTFNGKPLVHSTTSSGSSMAESTTTRERSGSLRDEKESQVEGSEAQQSLATESSWPSMMNSLSGKDADAVNSSHEGLDCDSKPGVADANHCRNSSVTGNAVSGVDKNQSQATEVHEAPEPTITSSSGGSGNSADRGKEAACSGKRRVREGEESECQSEVSNLLQPQVSQVGAVARRQDGEDEAQLKKPQQRGSTTKRSRAAEVHNLSERRRRDRINEKMKALQELIPNSNKTDKASMLDEAIEYLKMLQLQLQMMSMRSGMSIPSMVMPGGMQHLQMPQLPHMGPIPPMGMGMGMSMGMGMGMGMGMMDMGGGAHGRPLMPLPPHTAAPHSHNVSATSPAVSMVDSHDHRLPNASVMESLNVYLAQQRQMQMAPQPMSMDAFNAYMMHQHQQQHQQHQQQLQHQHPHSLHHLPNSMGGGAPQ